ncbi:MAG: PCMD domain-containing protein [Bacteroidaceae bacterium]|nr:PCMD domain-containing protein [Bacteroidaceae bacterium]
MMKKFLLPSLALLGMLMGSCIGDEPLNAECDIEEVSLTMADAESVFYHEYDTLQVVSSAVDSVGFLIRYDKNVGELPLNLKLTPGAKPYIMENGEYVPFKQGSLVDFSNEQVRQFRIVSQDGRWARLYRINIVHDQAPEREHLFMNITFDYFELNSTGKYHVWYGVEENSINYDQWATGNPGFNLSKSSAKVEEYPTLGVQTGGVDGGPYLKLETRDTGAFGRMVNMRLAAGNLFIGTFDVANALKDAMAATRFGLPFKHKPVKVTGWYKFKAGERFQDRKGNAVDRVDQPDIYCVMYRNQDADGNQVLLYGDDVLTSPAIVGLARITGVVETDEWTSFEMSLNYTSELDSELLENNGYSMTISFASSIEGASFEGAPGSVFCVDNVTIECEY